MMHHVTIAVVIAVTVVGAAGLAVAVWSIHRAHKRIVARNDALFERVDKVLRSSAKIAGR